MKLPDEPKEGFPILQWCRNLVAYLRATRITSVSGGRLRETASGTSLEIIFPKEPRQAQTKPPLWVTLRAVPAETTGDPPTWEVLAEYGHIVPRHNASAETGAPIVITSLPTNDAPLAVVEDDKLWVKLAVDVYGKVTAATWESGTNWPTDSPPSLIGGDDQTGGTGTRYVRIAEIIANPESTATPPTLIRNQLHTGHIDHFQPELCENTTTSPSSGDARVMKVWNSSAGRWDFRYLTEGSGITITENADSIEVKVDNDYAFPSAHPWKVTDAGSGNAAIAAGYVLGYYLQYAAADWSGGASGGSGFYPPDSVVLGPGGSYSGGTQAISGTQYIYAEVPKNTETRNEYSESQDEAAAYVVCVEVGDEIQPQITDSSSIVISSDAPNAYVPTTNKAAVCIAKVVNASNVLEITQYVTHNPTVFIPVVNLNLDSVVP